LTALLPHSLLPSGCDDISANAEQVAFRDIRLHPSDTYIDNNGHNIQLRLAPNMNDTIQTEASLRFAHPERIPWSNATIICSWIQAITAEWGIAMNLISCLMSATYWAPPTESGGR
jgi:hypothetical protein